jgi:hypothetical protein
MLLFFTRRGFSNITGYISCPSSEYKTVSIDLNTSEEFKIVRFISCFPEQVLDPNTFITNMMQSRFVVKSRQSLPPSSFQKPE